MFNKPATLLSLIGLTTAIPFAAKRDSWGGAVSLGPTDYANGAYIKHAVTYITPGAPPATQSGLLFLWPGMSNGTGDLVQTTLEDYDDNSWCGAKSGEEWCIRASVFGSFGQKDGDAGIVKGDDTVKIEYKLESDGTTWKQIVTNAETGEQLTTFSLDSGPYMTGYGTGTECNEGCTGTRNAQKYTNTTITLTAGDKNFGNTISSSQGAEYSGLNSNDDATVWSISSIDVPAMQ